MKRLYQRRTTTWIAAAVAAASLTGCNSNSEAGNQSGNANEPAGTSSEQAQVASSSTRSLPRSEMLSTVGLYEGTPPTEARTRQGTFAVANIDGVETLTLNGKVVRYAPGSEDAPQSVAANSSLTLVGAFELPQESVAWVVIGGGTACAGTHVLVGARNGVSLPGRDIPGCDDRGTMRRNGDKITFEAGGSAGTYENGMITVESKPEGF
jgi:hypothetical protein